MITFEYRFGKKTGIATDVDELIKQMDESENELILIGKPDYEKLYKAIRKYLMQNKKEITKP